MGGGRFFVDTTPLRSSPPFRRLFSGLIVAQMGSQLGIVAVSFEVYKLTGSSLDVGLISLAQLFPALFGAIVGGSIADAVDRRTLLVVTELSMALGTLGLALNAHRTHPALWLIFLLAAVNAGFAGCDGPTRTAVMITIVDRDSFVAANALRQLMQQLSVVVGPAVGGILLAPIGVGGVFELNMVGFVVATAAVLTLRPSPPHDGGTRFGWASITEGFAFLRGRQALQGCFVADLNAMVLGMPTALFPALGLTFFHGGTQAVGYLYAAPGVGALVITVTSGWATRVRRPGRAVVISVALWGAAIAAFGFIRSLPVALVLLAIAGAADVVSAVFRSTIIQIEAPDRLRGRLTSIQTAVVTGGPRLGNVEAGVVAALVNTQFSVISGGIGCVLGIAIITKLMPRFVNYDLPPGGGAPPEEHPVTPPKA